MIIIKRENQIENSILISFDLGYVNIFWNFYLVENKSLKLNAYFIEIFE